MTLLAVVVLSVAARRVAVGGVTTARKFRLCSFSWHARNSRYLHASRPLDQTRTTYNSQTIYNVVLQQVDGILQY